MRPILFLMFSSFGTVLATASYGMENEKFAVYYSDQAPVERFKSYQLLVLDRIHHPPLQPLAEDGKMLLGYISLGEIEETNPYYPLLKRHGLVLNENKNWPGSHFVDLRSPMWQQIVIEKLIPAVLRDGFHGVFFDTLDSPLELERSTPEKYQGMTDASVQMIEAVRMHYPKVKIMVNRAFPILPRIAPSIDMVLGESMLSDYDFEKKKYNRVQDAVYEEHLPWLDKAREHNPKLKIYTLDYADTQNRQAIADIYRLQRAQGFIPYVASVELDELVDEPGI